jgi:hypothetical protein
LRMGDIIGWIMTNYFLFSSLFGLFILVGMTDYVGTN